MSPAGRRGALLLAAAALAAFCAARLEVGTDITNFMPVGSRNELAALSGRLADSDLTRTLVVSIGADAPGPALRAAQGLAEMLRDHPEVARLQTPGAGASLQRIFELYYPRRYGLLSPEPEREIPALTDPAALRARAALLRDRLAGPASTLLEEIAAEDPLGAFERIAQRLRSAAPGLEVRDGHFVTRDGRHALLLVTTCASAFDSGAQTRLLGDLERSFEALRREAPAPGGDATAPTGLRLELAGAHRFAVHAERQIRRDIVWIASFSFLGVAALFLLVVGSARGFAVVSIPPLLGIGVAMAAGLLAFSGLDGLTMAFGATLMGVAIDYSNHVLIHHGLAGGEAPRSVVRRLRTPLLLGALTTMASFAGLVVTAFPAFREMSAFAIVGVAAALAVTLFALPDWMPLVPPLPGRARRIARRLGGAHAALTARRGAFGLAVLLLALLAASQLPRLRFADDLSSLTAFDPALLAEDRRVRERIAGFETGRIVVGLAPDPAAAVALDAQIQARLRRAVQAGALSGVRSVSDLLLPPELQRRNRELLRATPGLAERVERAFAEAGFRPEALAPFAASLRAPPPPPLRPADLREAGLGDLLAPLLLDLGDSTAAISYLRGVRDPDALRAQLADLPGVHLFEQRRFASEIYAEFRQTTLRQMAVGCALVLAVLVLHYRAWRPALAALLPSLLVALLLLGGLAAAGVPANLFHVMSLLMVMGMGVDYGVFLVDCAGRPERYGATLLSLLVSCLTTTFVLGTLAISSQPSLRAIGVTTGCGVVLSFLLAPVVLAWLQPGGGEARA